MDINQYLEDEDYSQSSSLQNSQNQGQQYSSQIHQQQNNSQLEQKQESNEILSILNQAYHTLDYLSNNPLFTDQNVHNWHAHILYMTHQVTEIAKQSQMTDYLEQLCNIVEQIRVRFDLILQNNYPQLSQFLLSLQILQNSQKSKQIRQVTQCRQFEYGEQVQEKDIQIEYKNYQLSNFQNPKYRENIKADIVSFLNQQGGTIFVGIRDYDMTVQGVDLSKTDKDTLKLYITKIKRSIEPDCNNLVEIDFIPLIQWGRFSKGKWILRIKVQQGEQNSIYAYRPNEQDRFMFASAFREDGQVEKYELKDFQQEFKSMILQGRQKVEKIQYAQPHDESCRCEADFVQDRYDIFRGSYENNKQQDLFLQQSFVDNSQKKIEEINNNQNYQLQIVQLEKQIVDLNSELQKKEKDNQDQAKEIIEIKDKFEKERRIMSEQIDQLQTLLDNKNKEEKNRNIEHFVQQQSDQQLSLTKQQQVSIESTNLPQKSDTINKPNQMQTPMSDQQVDIKKKKKEKQQMNDDTFKAIPTVKYQVDKISNNNQIKQDQQLPQQKAILPGKMWGNIFEFNPTENHQTEEIIQVQGQPFQMQEMDNNMEENETPDGEQQNVERRNRRDRKNEIVAQQNKPTGKYYNKNEQHNNLINQQWQIEQQIAFQQEYEQYYYQQQIEMQQKQMEMFEKEIQLHQEQQELSENEQDNDVEQLSNEPEDIDDQKEQEQFEEKARQQKEQFYLDLAKARGNESGINEEILDKQQYWMLIVTFFQHEAGYVYKFLIQKYPELQQNINILGQRKIVSLFFFSKDQLENAFSFCQESQIPYFKIIVKGIKFNNKGDNKTVIYFNTTQQQLKNPQEGLTQPILYLNNIKYDEKTNEIVKNIFKCEKIIYPNQKDKSKLIVSTKSEIIDVIEEKQYDLLKKDKSINEIGYMIDSTVQFKDIIDQNGLINQTNLLLSDKIVFGKFEYRYLSDSIQISFENSTEALIAYLALKESLSNDWFKIDRQVDLTSIYHIPFS